MELISVIIPAYNADNTITKCVNGIRGGVRNIEIIAVNDGSTDRTGEILDDIAREDNRLRVIHKKNGGVSAARNVGLEHARGDFVAWCDADDWVEPTWLQNQYAMIKQYNADIAVCHCYIEDGREQSKRIQNEEYCTGLDVIKNFVQHNKLNGILWNKLFRVQLLKGNIEHRFDEKLSCFEDDDFLWEVLKESRPTLIFTSHIDYHYNVNLNGLSNSNIYYQRIEAACDVYFKISV